MYLIEGESFAEVYKKSITAILGKGDIVAPRGTKTYELAPATVVIKDARKLLTMPKLRKGNYTFQLAEALWMLRGSNDLEEIAHYNGVWRYFEDEDNEGILNGAYGERLRDWDGVDQFFEVYEKLKKDPYSRQATMIIFDPDRDNAVHSNGSYSKDIPCTNYFNFQIRDGKLNMYVVMRSNDLHKGTLYDIPNFIIFQHVLAGWLNVEVGKYTHTAASFHIYESDVENFIEIFNDYDEQAEYDDITDPKMSLDEFNLTMPIVNTLEAHSRQASLEDIESSIDSYEEALAEIKNAWWRSVVAQIIMYNYRKKGATKEQFNKLSTYVINEYKNHVESWKAIKK
jgi:thymidylate synthase